jgi:diguanylate cyclase (GGDEF)-like protein
MVVATRQGASDSPIGSVLDGRYKILSCLGAGGMGVVYKAEQAQLDRVVAIKMPHASALANPTWRSRFEREARAMARFSHENIVQVFDFSINTDRPYIVLEFVQGQELADFLARPDRLSMRGLMYVLRQIAKGLDYAHERNVIHRDIKPENIVIADARRRVKIMDFGLARFEDVSSEVTRAGFVVGTPHYMAPEQVRGKEVSAAADLYALGVIVYCIFTGRLPFEGEGHAIMMKHASEKPPDPLALNPFLPSEVGAALLRALEKKPEARQESAAQYIDEIYAGLGMRTELSYGALLRGDSSQGSYPKEFWVEDEGPAALMLGARSGGDDRDGRTPPPDSAETSATIRVAAPDLEGRGVIEALQELDYVVKTHTSGMEALESILKRPPALLIVGSGLDDIAGPALCRLLQTHPSTKSLPVIFLGSRAELITPALANDGSFQVVSPIENAEALVDLVRRLLRKRMENGAVDSSSTASDSVKKQAPLLSFLRRLDETLIAQEVGLAINRSMTRGDDVGAVFHSLNESFRPFLDFTHQFCAILPERPGEQGTLLLDMNDPANTIAASYVSRPVIHGLRQASQGHKDFPANFQCHFARAWVPSGPTNNQTTVPLGSHFHIVPIEEGARLFGLYGFAYANRAPSPESAEAIKRVASQAFTTLRGAWNRRLLARARDRDEATGLWRRQKIIEYFELSLRSTPALEEPFCLMLLDIDALDSFNETFGLEGGDRVLAEVGKVLDKSCSGLSRAGRVGNDEFMIVLPKAGSGEAMRFGRQLLADIAAIPFEGWANPLPLTASAGLAFRAMEEKSSSYLARAARNALASAKAAGKGKIRAGG